MTHGLKTPDFRIKREKRMGLGLPISEIDQRNGQIHRNLKTVIGRAGLLCDDHIVLQG